MGYVTFGLVTLTFVTVTVRRRRRFEFAARFCVACSAMRQDRH